VHELNATGGIAGREVRLRIVDGAQPVQAARAIRPLADAGRIEAVVGWHLSSVRRAIAPIVAGRLPYVYTALYEGGERTPGVFVVGETPGRQLLPAMRWYRREHGVRRWCVVGNDYVWPRETAAAARVYAGLCDGAVTDELYLPLGTEDFGDELRRIEACDADAVLMLLVGDDAARFNRAFAAYGLHQRCLRLSTHMDENILLATGAEATDGLWATAGFFETLATAESLDFSARYAARFGVEAPVVGSLGESCFEGVRLLAALAERARSLDVRTMCAVGETVSYEGPRGVLRLRGNHLTQRLYLARADAFDFHIVTQL
jgi:urea transport system substrate-binding protein